MAGYKPIDDRQVINRSILQQLFPYVGSQTLDVLMSSINQDLTVPLNVTASNPASLVINVGAAIVSNSESNRQKSISFIGTSLPNSFAGTTVTFPSTSGGNITTGQGGSYPLTLPSGDFVAVLLSLNTIGVVTISIGTPVASIGSVVVPAPTADTDPFSYVILSNVGGTIQNVTQSAIYQLAGGGSGSSSSVPTVTSLLSGSGTYTTPVGVSYLKVRMVGGGGGGGGSTTAANAGSGGNGSSTTFGTSLLTCNGGGGGAGNSGSSQSGGTGGTATCTGPIPIVVLQGGSGANLVVNNTNAEDFNFIGGPGASSPFGGAGGASNFSIGDSAVPNTGSGGAGAECTSTVSGANSGGAGGGAGGYIEAIITAPLTTYSYMIGTGGTAGTAGTSGQAGGAGGSGIIVIEEYYS
jgi:hypothetical protein